MTDKDGQKTAAFMMAAGGLKPRDIAAILGLAEGQVVAWLNRADEAPENDAPVRQGNIY